MFSFSGLDRNREHIWIVDSSPRSQQWTDLPSGSTCIIFNCQQKILQQKKFDVKRKPNLITTNWLIRFAIKQNFIFGLMLWDGLWDIVWYETDRTAVSFSENICWGISLNWWLKNLFAKSHLLKNLFLNAQFKKWNIFDKI